MKVLQSMIRWFKAKDSEVAEKIERENEVAFAKQDLESMQNDLSQVTNSIGEVKATLIGLKRDMGNKERNIRNLEEDARSLLEKGREDLALKICAEIESLQTEVNILKNSVEQQEKLIQTLEDKRRVLQDAVRQAESSLRILATMASVARASEKVSQVNVGNSSSALARFKDREKNVQRRLDKAKAINEMQDTDSGKALGKEVDEALGRGRGNEVLARLKKESNTL